MIYNCNVPECLRSTVWEKIEDISNYDAELGRVVMSIFGQSDKPPLGAQPSYVQTIIDTIPNLTKVDTLALKLSCQKAIEQGYPYVDTEPIWSQLKPLDLTDEQLKDSLEVLDMKGYIEATRTSAGITHFKITTYGFDEYARVYLKNYQNIIESVAFQIVNYDASNNSSISEALKLPQMIADHVLNILNAKGLIRTTETIGGGMLSVHIVYVSPELKRLLE